MPEILLHYIWQRELFRSFSQSTTDGRRIEVLSVGMHNTDAGPDFTNVRLRIEETPGVFREWCGNVEMHLQSSDWYRHRHHLDAAYDNVILHVVRHADKAVFTTRGEAVMQCELQYPAHRDYLSLLIADARLMDSAYATRRCAQHLLQDPGFLTLGWRQTMLSRRLECKADSIHRLLAYTTNSWEQALYISLAHAFGFHTNGVPFEQLAISTPLSYLQKHRNSLMQLTAILLGQSGLLAADDELYKEYAFLRAKFSLTPMEPSMWKLARIRPQNAPQTRIRQFARLLYQSEFLFSKMMETNDVEALRMLFTTEGMGRDSVDSLLINVAVPFKYAHRRQSDALELLQALSAEDNRIIRQWRSLGQKVESAADSQALIHLYQTCCQAGQCLNCDVAYQIFLNAQPLSLDKK